MPRDRRLLDGPPHIWLPGVAGKTPVLGCRFCPIIWWPDRSEPKSPCGGPVTQQLEASE